MRKIGILCAVELELLPYRRVLRNLSIYNKAKLTFYIGTIDKIEVVVLACGVGKVNAAIATQLLIDHFKVQCIIVSGTAGALDPHLVIGDSVISTQAMYYDVEPSQLIAHHPQFPENHILADENMLNCCRCLVDNNEFSNNVYFGKIVTGEAFVKENREQLFLQNQALCVDMETASIAHVCFVFHIPFIAVRSISDIDIHTINQLGSFHIAAKNSFAIVRRLLEFIYNRSDIQCI